MPKKFPDGATVQGRMGQGRMEQLCKAGWGKAGWGNCDMRFRTDLHTTLYKSRLCVMCNAHPKQWFDSPERAALPVDAVHRVAAHSTAHPHSG
eukprot:4605245-Prymnesium_polylepis.1